VYRKRIPAGGGTNHDECVWVRGFPLFFNRLLTSHCPARNPGTSPWNKDLDLPIQRNHLAQFRCDEIVKTALDVFNEQVWSVRRPVEARNVVEGLSGLIARWKEATLCSSSTYS
jgi:Root hair defective 3 GTP-binding protein (RHD3)